jgi:hypothetical protein
MRKKFVVKPEQCLSTHGGGGYAYGSFYQNGKIVCGICGYKCDTSSTANIPEFIRDVPHHLTKAGKKEALDRNKKWYEFWK